MPKPAVFIVDEDAGVREPLLAIVASMQLASEVFTSASGFLAAYEANRPGCLLVDLQVSDVNGIELLAKLPHCGIKIPVIAASSSSDVRLAVSAMKSGAADFLQKPYQADELRQSIGRAIEMDQARRVRETRSHDADMVLISLLNSEEREVLEMIVAGKPNKAIASKLQVSVRTVHIRRSSLMKKLEVQSRAELVRVAVAVQLLAEAAPSHDSQLSPFAQTDAAQGEAPSKDKGF